MLADMYLWIGDYSNAEKYAQMVIDNKTEYFKENYSSYYMVGEYPLIPDNDNTILMAGLAYQYNFGEGGGPESIFELEFSESKTDGTKSNDVPAAFFYRFIAEEKKEIGYGLFAPAEELWKELSSPQIFLSNKDTRIKESIHVDNEANPEIVDIAKYTYSSIMPSLPTGSTLAYVGRLTKNDANWVFYRVSDMMLIKAEALICMMGEEESERNDSLGQAAFDLIKAIADRSAPNTSSTMDNNNYSTKTQ